MLLNILNVMKMRKKLILFDLDGTVWDATETNRKSFEDVGKEFFGPSYTLTLEQLKQDIKEKVIKLTTRS